MARACRKGAPISRHEMTFNPAKPNLGVMGYGKGKMITGRNHPGAPKHLIKAVQERRKMSLTSTRT